MEMGIAAFSLPCRNYFLAPSRATGLLSVPMLLISTSTRSPCFMLAVAPSVPIHTTSPGYKRQARRHVDQEIDHAEDHVVGRECDQLLAIQPDFRDQVFKLHVRFDPRTHRLEGVGVLRPPQRAVAPSARYVR